MRCIGRLRSEASPSNVARDRAAGDRAHAPAGSRCRNCRNRAAPRGCGKAADADAVDAPRALAARARPWRRARAWPRAVLSTSSPSSRPAIVVSPTVSAPRIRARCEIDLSPGTRTRPGKRAAAARRSAASRRDGWFTGGILGYRRAVPSTRRAAGAVIRRRPADGAIDSAARNSPSEAPILRAFRGTRPVAKPELGTKRICPETGRKFYDLNKTPIISPYTGKVVPIVVPPPRSRRAKPRPPRPRPPRRCRAGGRAPETAEAEFVSLEDAEAEQQGEKKPAAPAATPKARTRKSRSTRPSTMPPSSRRKRKATTTSPTSSATASRTKKRPDSRKDGRPPRCEDRPLPAFPRRTADPCSLKGP